MMSTWLRLDSFAVELKLDGYALSLIIPGVNVF